MERLQKIIAQAGVTSRRKAEALIQEGKVKVNGSVVTELGTKVSPHDKIEVNNIPIEREEPVYFLFYKPTGVISAVSDDKGRKVVTDFFHNVNERIFPIGRLDYDTSGVLLLTNDGEFANMLMHPRYNVDKEYIVKVAGIPTKQTLRALERGVRLEDGKTAPAVATLISSDRQKNTAIISLTIHEGRNRQVRRMLEAVGHKVLKLKRERYAFLTVRAMQPGDYRQLKPHEVKRLRDATVT
ncbi:ribosomal large subunit pseudouridine synthase B [Pullulanibacillus camelliae]|uniref:Pseudouridine synthase n=1 Tax=Pullulanibacillus camelliae TaxID=1707096 RepID=A0A8J2VUT6_9BACL|nr:pseudouridine synthase [Pullulanibacillus camelliae]GGE38411.1 ribosomal large subunit pseudouridine synthase B [Pullulanibacillus camelliae]